MYTNVKNEHENVSDWPWTYMTMPSMNPSLGHARRHIYYIRHISLILLMLVQNWNKSTYLGPSNFGNWAQQTKRKTSLVKPAVLEKTRNFLRNPKTIFLGKPYQIFPEKIVSRNPNTLAPTVTTAQKDRNNPKTIFWLTKDFSTSSRTQKN